MAILVNELTLSITELSCCKIIQFKGKEVGLTISTTKACLEFNVWFQNVAIYTRHFKIEIKNDLSLALLILDSSIYNGSLKMVFI
jgi:hypothetical protein